MRKLSGHKKLKVILIHLPSSVVVSGGYRQGPTYIPLQAGYLKAMAHQEGLFSDVDIEILSCRDAYLSSDSMLIDLLTLKEPDVIGFTLYNCSCARSLYIAGKIKERLPAIQIIAGGPDVTLDHAYVVNNPAIDIGCVGEGEYTFVEILKNLLAGLHVHSNIDGIFYREGSRVVATRPRAVIRNLSLIPSPLLLNLIAIKDYTCHFIMTSRGCGSRCSYCAQGSRPWVHFPVKRILEEVVYLKNAGVKYITFFDSNFINNHFYCELLRGIKKLNRNKEIQFNCFLYADQINEAFADLLKNCNFVDVQIGLQTVNAATLSTIERKVDTGKFLKNISLLRSRNIRLLGVDLIAGLPKETLSDINTSIAFLEKNSIKPNIYRLHLFPGTRLKKDAHALGISYRKTPPYFVVKTDSISHKELNSLDNMNVFPSNTIHFNFSTYFPTRYLAKTRRKAGLGVDGKVSKVIIDIDSSCQTAGELVSIAEGLKRKLFQQSTFWFKVKDMEKDFPLIESFVGPLKDANPYLNWKVIIETANRMPVRQLKSLINRILDGNPPGFGRHLFCALLPGDTGLDNTKEWARIGALIPVCLSVVILNNPFWQQKIDALFKVSECSEILIDFSYECDMQFIVNALILIADKSRMYNKAVSFRNCAFNHSGVVPVGNDKLFPEPVMMVDVSLKLRAILQPDRLFHLDVLAWQLRINKMLATTTNNRKRILSLS